MGSQLLQVFYCFADITILLLLSHSLIVVCDAVANAAFVSGSLVSLAPFFEYCVHWSQSFQGEFSVYMDLKQRSLLAYMAAPLACLYGCTLHLLLQLHSAYTAATFACLYGCALRLPLRLRLLLAFMAALSLAHTAATLACLYGCN